MTRYLLYCICLCLLFAPELHAQGLRESPREDTLYHFYPLDSTLLTLYHQEGINQDSLVFMSRKPVDIGRSKLSQAAKLLPAGSYLRVHVSQLSVEKEVCSFMDPVNMTYVPDGDELILFVKDPKWNRLVKNLVLYYRGHTIVFSPGKGGYVFPLNELKGKDNFLLLRDGNAFYARTFVIGKEAATQRSPAYSSGPVLIPTAGYMLLSKPKYMPGDTLKAYTYQTKGRKGKPVRKRMQVNLVCEGQTLWQKSIKRQKPGSYRIDLPLPDTFLLNKNYTVQFQYRKRGRYYGQQRDFSYEQYTLDKATYDFFLGKNSYKAGDSILYYISAKDESGFAQPFGRYSIDVFTRDVSFIRKDTFRTNVNKPLYHTEGQLSGDGLESHPLPELLLPPGNSRLSAVFKLVNEQNEEKVITREFEYDNTAVEFVFRQDRDSLLVDYLYRRKSMAKELSYVVMNFRGDTVRRARLTTPARIPVQLDYNQVSFLDGKQLLHNMHIEHSLAEQIGLKAAQDKDSVRISFRSPGNRTVYYTILKNGKLLQADSGLALNFRVVAASSDRFEFTLARESASGSNEAYQHWYIQPERKKLRISDDLPEDILLGASVSVRVQVRDFEGRPAKNVDLSSYAIKNQFKEEGGVHSFYFHTPQQDTLFERLKSSAFEITTDEPFRYQSNKPLRVKDLQVLSLHRYPYYRFYFPSTAFYQEDMPLSIPDTAGNTAQMSIQIIQGRQLTSPVWITADERPVYYTLSARQNVVALPAGKHRVQCRIADKVLDLGLLDFKARHKKILSVNLDSLATVASHLVIRDSLNGLSLDSVMTERILDQSYLALGIPQREAVLAFKDMSLNYRIGDFSPAATYFLGNGYTFLGPFYETSARIQRSKDTTDLFLGDHRLHFFDTAGTLIRTMPVPRSAWPANVNQLNYSQVFDTLYYPPVPGIPYQAAPQMRNDFPARKEENPVADPLFGAYDPKWTEGDTAISYVVFDPGHKVLSFAVVQRDQIGKSLFRSGDGNSVYSYRVPGNGKADLFFQLSTGRNILYRDVPLGGITALYVNADSLVRDTALLEDLVFYQNVYSSLTSTFDQLFTNEPERVKLSFERSQKGRNSSMILGRVINSTYADEDVYLEDHGRFVAGTRMDSYGNFRFLDIAPGNYMIKIHPPGTRPVYVYNLDVRKGDQYTLSIDVLPEEKPVLMSAVNPHFELLVRRSDAAGRIRLFDREHKDLLINARISFIMEGDTMQTVTAVNGHYAFPVQQWPADKSVHLLISAPGFEYLWVKDFSVGHGLQYDWKFFLQQKLRKSDKDNSIFINGAEVASHVPASPAWEVPPDSLYNVAPNGPLQLSLQATDGGMLTAIPLSLDIYKKNRYQKTIPATIGQLQRLKLELDPGADYTIDIRSPEFQAQRIFFRAAHSGQYQVHLLPFTDGEGTPVPKPDVINTTFVPNGTRHGELFGTVLDETSAPFGGLRVEVRQGGIVKGGTITEDDGSYSVKPLPPGTYDVEFSMQGYGRKRYTGVVVTSGGSTKLAVVKMSNDSNVLREVVIMQHHKNLAYRTESVTSSSIERPLTRSVSDLASLSPGVYQNSRGGGLTIGGARADGTVYVLDGQVVQSSANWSAEELQIEKSKPRAALTREQGAAMKADPLISRLRQLFSDEGYFRTGLRTDKSGNAYFEARFPDDITSWDVHQVALGRGYYFGQEKKQVRAYKPVMINVRVPRYMYLGDSLEIGAQLRNLLDEPRQASWSVLAGVQPLLERSALLKKGITDSAAFRADSLKPVSFYSRVSTTDSFYDQELRVMPVKEQAIFSHADTIFPVTDTAMVLYRPSDQTVRLRLSHTLAEYLDGVAAQLEAYPYSCLEQKCSKLKGLIYQGRMARHIGQPFAKRKAIKDLISSIRDMQNMDGSFGWWSGPGDPGMTQIALDALKAAAAEGYAEQSSGPAAAYLIRELGKAAPSQKIDILGTLLLNGYSISSYTDQFKAINADELPDPFDQLQYQRIREQYGDSLDRTRIWGLLQQCEQRVGQSYAPMRFSREPHVLLLRAFRLFKGTPLEQDIHRYMQQYLDGNNHTRTVNTYEQALVLENFFDFALGKEAKSKSAYRINSGKQQQVFPLLMQLKDSVQLQYKGTKAWLTIDREYKQYRPVAKDTFFRIQARMDGPEQQALQLNKDYQLRVSVFNFLPYEHVMITIPLPAGTVLKHKIPYGPEVRHIEYYNDRVILYCTALSAGSHDFMIPVRAAFRGKCAWPPARAELMYRPEVYGHNTFRSLEVR